MNEEVVITVEDFGGADKVREFYDKINHKFYDELWECWNDDFDEFDDCSLNEHIAYSVSECDEDDLLPPKVLEKIEIIRNSDEPTWDLSEEVYSIAKEVCLEVINDEYDEEDDDEYDEEDDEEDEYYGDYDDEDYDEDSASDEEKACHEIIAILNKYDVEIRGDELGGVWIGHNKIS